MKLNMKFFGWALIGLLSISMLSSFIALASTDPNSKSPLWAETIDVGQTRQSDFISLIEKLSSSKQFALRVGHIVGTSNNYLIQLWREDIKIIIVNPHGGDEFRFIIFKTCSDPVSELALNDVKDSFHALLREYNLGNQVPKL